MYVFHNIRIKSSLILNSCWGLHMYVAVVVNEYDFYIILPLHI